MPIPSAPRAVRPTRWMYSFSWQFRSELSTTTTEKQRTVQHSSLAQICTEETRGAREQPDPNPVDLGKATAVQSFGRWPWSQRSAAKKVRQLSQYPVGNTFSSTSEQPSARTHTNPRAQGSEHHANPQPQIQLVKTVSSWHHAAAKAVSANRECRVTQYQPNVPLRHHQHQPTPTNRKISCSITADIENNDRPNNSELPSPTHTREEWTLSLSIRPKSTKMPKTTSWY